MSPLQYYIKINSVMKQLKYILFTFVMVSLFPISLNGQNSSPSYGELISQIDVKIQDLIFQRKSNHAEQDNINNFVAEVGRWFTASSNIQTKIDQARGRSGDYSTFSNQGIQQEIQKLEQEQIAINGLNGGTIIQGVTYYSIDELRSAMTEKGKEVLQLINDDENLKNDIRSLDMERDRYTAEIEYSDKEDKRNVLYENMMYLEKKKNLYKYDLTRELKDLKDVNYWCARASKDSPIKCLHRKYYLALLVAIYDKQLSDTPGKEYDQNEFAGMIKNVRDRSNKVKKEAQDMIREKREEIKSLEQQYEALYEEYYNVDKLINIDPSGCWVIVIGSGRRPQINIVKNAYGEFDAFITDPGSIKYNRGKKLFTMARINASTFEGTEYSFDNSGAETRIPLRIIINKKSNSGEYRTRDDLLTLLRCY